MYGLGFRVIALGPVLLLGPRALGSDLQGSGFRNEFRV